MWGPMSFTENLGKAETLLARYDGAPILNHIGGEDRAAASGATFETISPIDLSVIGTAATGDATDIDAAAKAAHDAFSAWRDMDGAKRRAILHGIADGIVARAEEIALLECVDTGQALRFMSKAAFRGAENFRFFADKAPYARDGQSLFANNQMNVTSRRPIGPVGVITPWNTPFMLSTWKIAPALAAGCTVVHKPAELSPVTARILMEIAAEAGLPPGVWNLVNGLGEEAGRALTEHPMIKAIAFVGESATGKLIMKQGADTLKRVHFELGGKNPVVVFADADLERAADAAAFMIYSLNGERCTSSSRVLVEASVHNDFTAILAAKAKRLKIGHPLDPDTGARQSMRIAQEEIFGPVLTAIPFADEEEALSLANDVAYGLAGYLWTGDVTRAMRFSDNMDAGMIWVNSENVRHLPTPFGGTKESGIGRDGGDWSFDFYMETRNVAFATAPRAVPKLGL